QEGHMESSEERKQQRIKELFAKYVPAKDIDKILSGAGGLEEAREQTVDLALVKVEFDTLHELNARLDPIFDIVLSRGGIVMELVGNIAVITNWKDERLDVRSISEAIMKSDGSHVAVLHGQTRGYIGNVGTERKMSFTLVSKLLLEYFAKLNRLDYGCSAELSDDHRGR
ncbi:MAG TPA: hypothetical protein VG897_10825, partial [Terriglobales bacterium]|nr:hypothetical protein [Terriglobales bacterium]